MPSAYIRFKIMYSRYDRLITILFFASTVVSLAKFDIINAPIWLLCAYLYLFKVNPMKNLFTKILTSVNLLFLLCGYLLLIYQVAEKPIEQQADDGKIFGITINEKK